MLAIALCWTLLLSTCCLCSTLPTPAGERNSTSHGDPCGHSSDPSLVCCVGSEGSRLIRMHEECCNGRAVGRGEICCEEWALVRLSSPTHDSCCMAAADGGDTTQAISYSRATHYCNAITGRVRPIPPARRRGMSMSNRVSYNFQSFRSANFPLPIHAGTSRFHGMCRLGNDNMDAHGRRHRASCCGRVSYNPLRQLCCMTNLFDIPTDHGQCCYDQGFRLGDRNNTCLGSCGSNDNFNLENELCCDGVTHPSSSRHDVCCGTHKMSEETHVCCGEGTVLSKNGPHGCCRHFLPYVRRYMRCKQHGGDGSGSRVKRRTGRQFHSHSLCGRLPLWGRNWPQPRLQHTGRVAQIEGHITHVRKYRRNGLRLTLTPFRLNELASRSGISACLDTNTVFIATNLGPSARERGCRKKQLRRYLRNNILTVFFPLSSLRCSNSSSPVIRMPVVSTNHLMLRTPPAQ